MKIRETLSNVFSNFSRKFGQNFRSMNLFGFVGGACKARVNEKYSKNKWERVFFACSINYVRNFDFKNLI